jgi:putative FmdB family regulatory protein
MPPTYEWTCDKCDKEYETIQSIKEYNGVDFCPDCGNKATRVWSCNISFIGTKVEDAEYNVGLGKITKSKRHREEIAKSMGLEEIGNENPDKIHDKNEKEKADKRKKAWDSI